MCGLLKMPSGSLPEPLGEALVVVGLAVVVGFVVVGGAVVCCFVVVVGTASCVVCGGASDVEGSFSTFLGGTTTLEVERTEVVDEVTDVRVEEEDTCVDVGAELLLDLTLHRLVPARFLTRLGGAATIGSGAGSGMAARWAIPRWLTPRAKWGLARAERAREKITRVLEKYMTRGEGVE